MGLCVPEDSKAQAQQFKPNAKMERCIKDVKSRLRKKTPRAKEDVIKSSAIAICRSRLKQ